MAQVQRRAPILTVSVAAELAGIHPQTVRQYDRLGLVVASRTRGGGRRYSLADVDTLIEIQRLSQEEGINLAGIARIMELQRRVNELENKTSRLEKQLARLRDLGAQLRDALDHHATRENRVFAASSSGDVTMAEGIEFLRRALRNQPAFGSDAYRGGEVDDAGKTGAEGEGFVRDGHGSVVVWQPFSYTRYVVCED